MDFSFKAFCTWLCGTALAFISFAGFVLSLVNTSILHDDCGTSETCDNFFRRFWWTLMFHVGVMTVAFCVWLLGMHHNARIAIVGFLALVTTQLIELTGRQLTALDTKEDWPKYNVIGPENDWIDRDVLKGALAGYLMLSFADMMYMVIFGFEGGEDTTSRVTERPEVTPRKAEDEPATTTEASPPV